MPTLSSMGSHGACPALGSPTLCGAGGTPLAVPILWHLQGSDKGVTVTFLATLADVVLGRFAFIGAQMRILRTWVALVDLLSFLRHVISLALAHPIAVIPWYPAGTPLIAVATL